MIKLPITYTNFDDEEVTEDLYFHLSKSELIDMIVSEDGGAESLVDKLNAIAKSGDGAVIMAKFKEIIGLAYGQRVDGSGKDFYKSPELTQRFMGSLVFDELLTRLVTDAEFSATFVEGLMPRDLAKMAAAAGSNKTTDVALPGLTDDSEKAARNSGLSDPFDEDGNLLPWVLREPTQNEIMAMNTRQIQDVYKRKNSGWQLPDNVSS